MYNKGEKKLILEFEERIKEFENIINNHQVMINASKDEIKKIKNEIDKIRSKARLRIVNKCHHEMSQTPVIYYDSCGMDWCGFNDYHGHHSCWKCGYIQDEPLK